MNININNGHNKPFGTSINNITLCKAKLPYQDAILQAYQMQL